MEAEKTDSFKIKLGIGLDVDVKIRHMLENEVLIGILYRL